MNQYFYEDQVYTVDKKGSVKFGLVVENEVNFCHFPPFSPSILFSPLWIINCAIDKATLPAQSPDESRYFFQVPSDGEYENHSDSEKLLRKGELRVGRRTFSRKFYVGRLKCNFY